MRRVPQQLQAGALLIAFAEMTMLLRVQPFAIWNFPVLWWGYILTVDGLGEFFSARSMLKEHPGRIALMALLSSGVWWVFEGLNVVVKNWHYVNVPDSILAEVFFKSLAFSTVIPAVFATSWLLESLHLLEFAGRKRAAPSTRAPQRVMLLGIACFVLAAAVRTYFFWAIWLGFIFLLEPWNYLHGEPSMLQRYLAGDLGPIFRLMLAGLICGIFWEFWNYWAYLKWQYTIPWLGFLKVFEMPVLGYLMYPLFALEVYAMYMYLTSLSPMLKRFRLEL